MTYSLIYLFFFLINYLTLWASFLKHLYEVFYKCNTNWKESEKRKKLRDADYLSQRKSNNWETLNWTKGKKEAGSIITYTCRKYRSAWRIVTTMNVSTSAYLSRVIETKNSHIWKIMIVIHEQFLFNKIKSVS